MPVYTIEAFSKAERGKVVADPLWRERIYARNALEALRLACSLRGETVDESSFVNSARIGGAITDSQVSLIVTPEAP